MEGRCKTCDFFNGTNRCLRFPPQFTGLQQIVVGYITEEQETWGFPEVGKDDYCGEYKHEPQI